MNIKCFDRMNSKTRKNRIKVKVILYQWEDTKDKMKHNYSNVFGHTVKVVCLSLIYPDSSTSEGWGGGVYAPSYQIYIYIHEVKTYNCEEEGRYFHNC